MVHDNQYKTKPIDLTLDEIRSKLSGLHFSKEALSSHEIEILLLAESLLDYIDAVDMHPARQYERDEPLIAKVIVGR